MKKLTTIFSLAIALLIALNQQINAQTSYTWNGSTSTDWGTSTNWTPNGVPGSSDNVTIVSGTYDPVYDGSSGVTDFTISSDTLDLNGYTLSISGTAIFSGGYIDNGTVSSSGSNSSFSGTIFGAKVVAVSSSVFLNGSTFLSTSSFTKTGSSNNAGNGGNYFADTCRLNNIGSGYLYTGSSPDTFMQALYLYNSGSSQLAAAVSGTGHYFGGDVYLKSSGSSNAILIGYSTGQASTLAYGKKLIADTFSTGQLYVVGLDNSGPYQELTLTGNASAKVTSCNFDGGMSLEASKINLTNNTFGSASIFNKTGNTADNGTCGGNIYDGDVTFINSGNGIMKLGVTYPDTSNSKTYIYNLGLSYIAMAYNAEDSYFDDTVFVSSTDGQGVYFGNSGVDWNLAPGKVIALGDSGFTSGKLRLINFTGNAGTPEEITLTGTASFAIEKSHNVTCDLNITAPYISLGSYSSGSGNTFSGKVKLVKTGTSGNSWYGGNIFNDSTFLTITGGGLTTSSLFPDTFNGPTVLTNQGSGNLSMAITAANYYGDVVKAYNLSPSGGSLTFLVYNTGASTFDGDVYLNCTSSGGITFGPGNIPTITMTEGHTVAIGDTGFTAGTLKFRYFTQEGSTPVDLELAGTADLSLVSCEFGGNFTFSGTDFYLSNAEFDGEANLSRTSGSSKDEYGTNVFHGSSTIINNGTGDLTFRSEDTFYDDVTFEALNAGIITTGSSDSHYEGNIHLNDPDKISMIGYGSTGKVIFSGSGVQTITADSTGTIAFKDIEMNKSGGYLSLGHSVSVSDSLIFKNGLIQTDNFAVVLKDNAKLGGVSDTSYVEGRVKKVGNDAFTFPVGKNGHYRPISMSAPSSTSDEFLAEYKNENSDDLYEHDSADASINEISTNEYWNLDRVAGTSDVDVTLSWDDMSCAFDTLDNLRIAAWNPAWGGTGGWIDLGNGGTTGDTAAGTIVTSSGSTVYGPFTLASVDTFRCVACRADAGEDIDTYSGQGVRLGEDATSGVTYEWAPATSLSSSTASNPVADPNSSILYKLISTNANDCEATDYVQINVKFPPPMPHYLGRN